LVIFNTSGKILIPLSFKKDITQEELIKAINIMPRGGTTLEAGLGTALQMF